MTSILVVMGSPTISEEVSGAGGESKISTSIVSPVIRQADGTGARSSRGANRSSVRTFGGIFMISFGSSVAATEVSSTSRWVRRMVSGKSFRACSTSTLRQFRLWVVSKFHLILI